MSVCFLEIFGVYRNHTDDFVAGRKKTDALAEKGEVTCLRWSPFFFIINVLIITVFCRNVEIMEF